MYRCYGEIYTFRRGNERRQLFSIGRMTKSKSERSGVTGLVHLLVFPMYLRMKNRSWVKRLEVLRVGQRERSSGVTRWTFCVTFIDTLVFLSFLCVVPQSLLLWENCLKFSYLGPRYDSEFSKWSLYPSWGSDTPTFFNSITRDILSSIPLLFRGYLIISLSTYRRTIALRMVLRVLTWTNETINIIYTTSRTISLDILE